MNNFKRVIVAYYSATGNTKRVTREVAIGVSEYFGARQDFVDLSVPSERLRKIELFSDDILIIGMPTYRGKLPAYISDDISKMFTGDDTPVVEVITYGNRSFDNSLAELTSIMKNKDFIPAAAIIFPCCHAYTDMLAPGRPDTDDLVVARSFATNAAKLISEDRIVKNGLNVPGDANAPFYIPLGNDGKAVNFQSSKPITDASSCTDCGECVHMCPLGSISVEDPSVIDGPCFKCQACVRGCKFGAKSFVDPLFVSHVKQLEMKYAERKEIMQFFQNFDHE